MLTFTQSAIVVVLLCCACVAPDSTTSANGVTMSSRKVVRIADQAMKAAGYVLQNYQRPKTHYELTRHSYSWSVIYDQKPPADPGGDVMVTIEDRTGMVLDVRHGL